MFSMFASGSIGYNHPNILKNKDCIIHLAARQHIMNETSNNPSKAFNEANVDYTIKLANFAAKLGVRRFIFLSSIKVNGEKTKNSN